MDIARVRLSRKVMSIRRLCDLTASAKTLKHNLEH